MIISTLVNTEYFKAIALGSEQTLFFKSLEKTTWPKRLLLRYEASSILTFKSK